MPRKPDQELPPENSLRFWGRRKEGNLGLLLRHLQKGVSPPLLHSWALHRTAVLCGLGVLGGEIVV